MTREQEALTVQRVLDGNADEYEKLVLEYQKNVYNLALRMTGDPEDAADRKASGGRMLEGMTYAAWRKKQFTYSAASGIMTSGGDEMHIEIEIDRFTPCLLDRDTGQLVDTDYRLVSKAELAQTKKQGWLFNWTHKSLSGSDVYKLCVKGSGEIQGLVAVEE